MRPNLETIELPVVSWLSARTRLAGGPAKDGWQVNDPIVRHLAPALWALERQGCIQLGPRTRQAAAHIYFQNHAHWLIWERRGKVVLEALKRENVSVIPLKGVILKNQLYGDFGLRQMNDVDILVREDEFWKAARLLSSTGLKPTLPKGVYSLARYQEQTPGLWPTELEFRDEEGLIVELHRHLLATHWFLEGFDINMEGVWARSIPASGENGDAPWSAYLSPYDTLAHLCLHQAMHGLQAMYAYLDIDLWIRSQARDWDWSCFINTVETWQMRSAAYHALLFSKYFMGTPLPDNLLPRLDPGRLARLHVGSLITAYSLLAMRPTLGVRYPMLVKLALLDSPSREARLLSKLLYPDRLWREQRYAGSESIFWFWKHLVDVFKRGNI